MTRYAPSTPPFPPLLPRPPARCAEYGSDAEDFNYSDAGDEDGGGENDELIEVRWRRGRLTHGRSVVSLMESSSSA